MTTQKKKELARLLWTQGVVTTQTELAERIGISQNALSRWKKAGDWDAFKKSLLTTRQEELANLYDQLAELNAAIKSRPEGERYANSKEADTLTKLTAAIRQLETETSIAEIVDVFMDFGNWLRSNDLAKAKELVELQDAYVKSKM